MQTLLACSASSAFTDPPPNSFHRFHRSFSTSPLPSPSPFSSHRAFHARDHKIKRKLIIPADRTLGSFSTFIKRVRHDVLSLSLLSLPEANCKISVRARAPSKSTDLSVYPALSREQKISRMNYGGLDRNSSTPFDRRATFSNFSPSFRAPREASLLYHHPRRREEATASSETSDASPRFIVSLPRDRNPVTPLSFYYLLPRGITRSR